MSIKLTGKNLTIDDLVKVARHNEKVEIPSDTIDRIQTCRNMLEKKIQAHEIMYGVNTGIGSWMTNK